MDDKLLVWQVNESYGCRVATVWILSEFIRSNAERRIVENVLD